MKIKVLFPFTQFPIPYQYTTEMELRKGELVVVRFNGKERVGIVFFLNSDSNDRIQGKVIRKADTLDQYDFWREFEKLLLKQRVLVSDEALEVYRTTNGNRNISRDMAERKLTRNLLLSHKSTRLYITGTRMICLQYGALRLYYRDGMIHKIESKCIPPVDWVKDEFAYDYFGAVLGINEGELIG